MIKIEDNYKRVLSNERYSYRSEKKHDMDNKSVKNAKNNCQVTSLIEQHLERMRASYFKETNSV